MSQSGNLQPNGEATHSPSTPEPTRSRARRALGWALRIAIFLAIFVGVSRWQGRDHLPQGGPAPSFALARLNGGRVNLEDYRGKRIMLHFWATWCGVCRQEFSMLNRLHENLEDDTVLLSVVADADTPGLGEFVKEQGIEYPVLEGTRRLLSAYKVNAFPTNYFIDADGQIVSSSVGLSTEWASRARLSCAR